MSDGWKELYQAAMLELHPQELQRRIALAEQAIQERIAELRRDDSRGEEERRELDDGLRAIARSGQRRMSAGGFPGLDLDPKQGGVMKLPPSLNFRECRRPLRRVWNRSGTPAETLEEQWRELRRHATMERDPRKLSWLRAEFDKRASRADTSDNWDGH